MDIATLIRFFTQVSLMVAGAACLWGYVFSRKALGEEKNKDKFWELSSVLMVLFSSSFIVFIFGWWFLFLFIYTGTIYGHEGIVYPTQDFVQAGFKANLPIVVLATVVGFLGIGAYKKFNLIFKKLAHKFFAIQFILLSIIVSLSSYTNSFSKFQISYIFHNWHSIITLGTVITVDFLYLYTSRRDSLKRILYPAFPLMSAFIWIGLGIDFLSSMLFGDINFLQQGVQFIFNQVVIGIIIINGALLSVYLNDSFMALIKKTRVEKPSEALIEIARISGAVSIISWLTVMFLDFVDIPLKMGHFFAIYLGLIGLIYLLKPIVEKKVQKLV